ncbi:PREDICTED: T-cell surface glycoprotein CD1c3-like isoform X1 [Chinchilla lanigera]|uniref:T-cell surface glycoprotein CD1c3-like isoform X1 n=1 Tax=Chinchilla lanigera TaxID=34839 RepID=UPI000695B6C9|nr:PREDICTED: T-cell surface glycoprotein CD1c3-like isoform X1 [Chinchilla lanigera]
MLFPLLPLLAVLLPESGNAKAVQERTTFQLIQISFYANQSWAQNQGSGWLGELQTHGWDSESGTILFLHTWSRGNFSNEELLDLQLLFRFYFIGLTKEVQNYASQLQFKYPFNVQARAGCELHSGESLKTFLQVAFEGSNFMSLRDTTCVPSPEGGSRAQKVCDLVDQYEGIKETANNLMRNTCPRFLLGLLDAGKMDLQRQVRPEAWLSSSPTLESGRLLLVCHISGFYPKPIWVMWMRGEQEQLGTKEGDILPHADGTWYRRVTLDVATEEASGLSCRVRHSSLGDQDIILYWGHRLSMNWIALALVVPLVLLIALGLWCKKRCSYRNIP